MSIPDSPSAGADARPRVHQGQLPLVSLMLAMLLGAGAGPAHATLGGDLSSVYADGQALGVMPVQAPAGVVPAGLQRYDLALGAGWVHEYTGPAGQVFAITFSGGPTPNLGTLLGNYYDQYRSAQAAAPGQLRSVSIQTGTLRAHLAGRPYAVSGRAWVPPLTPAGVTVEGLQ